MALMKKASITEAKNNLSALIDGLKSGASVLIVDRGPPVARLEPVTTSSRAEEDGRLARLVRDGIDGPASSDPERPVCECAAMRQSRDVRVRALLKNVDPVDEILGRLRDRAVVDGRGLDEAGSGAHRRRLGDACLWGTHVECASAIARLEREGAIEERAVNQAFERLTQLAGGWHVARSDRCRPRCGSPAAPCASIACGRRVAVGRGVRGGGTPTRCPSM